DANCPTPRRSARHGAARPRAARRLPREPLRQAPERFLQPPARGGRRRPGRRRLECRFAPPELASRWFETASAARPVVRPSLPAAPAAGRLRPSRGYRCRTSLCPHILTVHRGDLERLRVLRRVRILGPGIHAQSAQDATAEGPARHHPLDRLLDDPLGMLAGEDRALAAPLDAAGVAGMPIEDAGRRLVAG